MTISYDAESIILALLKQMFSRTMLLVTLSCFIGDTDTNPFKNLDVTSAAGSDLSAIRQTGYFIKIVIYYAQRAKIRY